MTTTALSTPCGKPALSQGRTADIARGPTKAGFHGALLILQNPGDFTRHCLADMTRAAQDLGIPTVAIEMGEVWGLSESQRRQATTTMARVLRERNVRAVLSSGMNGLIEWPCTLSPEGRPQPFFEQLGIPHLMWWTDHPQWANERIGLREDLQAVLRSTNNHHFVKSESAAEELRTFLGWPNCYGLPVAEDPGRLRPVETAAPEFDVVTIVGSPPVLSPRLEPFLAHDDPDVDLIRAVVAEEIAPRLSQLWAERAPRELVGLLTDLGNDWIELRRAEPLRTSWRAFQSLPGEHRSAKQWLLRNARTYFDAVHILWEFGRWQRPFYLRYLARYFRVGVLGYDWSSVGLRGGKWVHHDDQPAAYARGRIALNISQCGDEEGVAHKPFQIAACGVPLAHIDSAGLAEYFEPDKEAAVFRTPREAREQIDALLRDPQRRERMAQAARARLISDHTWTIRLRTMLSRIGLPVARSSNQ